MRLLAGIPITRHANSGRGHRPESFAGSSGCFSGRNQPGVDLAACARWASRCSKRRSRIPFGLAELTWTRYVMLSAAHIPERCRRRRRLGQERDRLNEVRGKDARHRRYGNTAPSRGHAGRGMRVHIIRPYDKLRNGNVGRPTFLDELLARPHRNHDVTETRTQGMSAQRRFARMERRAPLFINNAARNSSI